MNHNFPIFLSLKAVLTLIISIFGAASASAVTDLYQPADTAIRLRELSVIALKSGLDLTNQPISSTILGKSGIEHRKILTSRDASAMVPNLFIPEYGSRMTSAIFVRGLGSRMDMPAMGMNIDNIPILNKDNYDFDIIDINRIEVLRGPQSTLYGRNTMGGLINISTLSPLQYQGTRFLAEYASANSYRATVSHYAKLSRTLGLGIMGYYRSTDGFFTNLYNGKKCDWEHLGSGRIKLQWQPSNDFSLSNVFSMSILHQGGYPYEYLATGEINYNDTCFYRRTSIMDGITAQWHKTNMTLTSITSFQYINDNMTMDQDFLPLSYFTLTQARKEYGFTQEFVVKSNADKDYHWVCGAYGFYKHYNMDAPVTFKDYGIEQLIEKHRNDANPDYPIKWDSREFLLGDNFRCPDYGAAVYHQSSYDVGRWTFSGGFRLDFEHSALNYHSSANTGFSIIDASTGGLFRHDDVNIDFPGHLSKSFFQFLPKVSALYHLSMPSPSNVYFSISKGYKSGGFNTQMFSDVLQERIMNLMGLAMKYDVDQIVSYKPEKCWTFEAGSHIECYDRRIQTDISAFYIRCTDQQLTVYPDGTTTGRITTNAGRTRSFGAELAMKIIPVDALEINVSYGYTNAKFTRFNNGKQDYAGNFIPYAPQNTIFAGANYTLPLSAKWASRIVISADVRAVGDMYWDEANTVKQSLYALPGASIAIEGNHYSLSLWGTNLSDTDYRSFYFVSIGNAFLQRGKPRQLGVTLRVNI